MPCKMDKFKEKNFLLQDKQEVTKEEMYQEDKEQFLWVEGNNLKREIIIDQEILILT